MKRRSTIVAQQRKTSAFYSDNWPGFAVTAYFVLNVLHLKKAVEARFLGFCSQAICDLFSCHFWVRRFSLHWAFCKFGTIELMVAV